MTMRTKQEIFSEKLAAYVAADRAGKGEILDSVCFVTGCHRKAAGRRFRTLQMRSSVQEDKRGRKVIYGKAVTAALREIWEIGNRICAERLRPEAREDVRVLRHDGMWTHDERTTALLLQMSMGTMKARIAGFENVKKKGGRGTTKPSDLK